VLFAGSKQSSWVQQFGLLAWRSGRDALRNKETIYAKVRALWGGAGGGGDEHTHTRLWCTSSRTLPILLHIPSIPSQKTQFGISALLGLLVGLMYSNMGYDQQSIYDRKGVLFFVTINQAFGLITTVCGTFPKERKIVLRERGSNSYHISAYYLAKV
jgi:hypothetical protein